MATVVGGCPSSGPAIAETTPPSAALQSAWRALCKADELVHGFGTQGWIADADLAVVDERGRALARRVGRVDDHGADMQEQHDLRRELEQLTTLLVALADEAVARQPSLAPTSPVVVTLEDARRRLAETGAADGETP